MKIIKGLIALTISTSISLAADEDLRFDAKETFDLLRSEFPQVDQGQVNTLHTQFNGNFTNIWNYLNNLGKFPTSAPKESEELQLELASIESMISTFPGGLEGFPVMVIQLQSKVDHDKKEIEFLFLQIEDKEQEIKFYRDTCSKNSEKIIDFSLKIEEHTNIIQTLEKEIDQLEKVIPETQENLNKHYQFFGITPPTSQSTPVKQEEKPGQRKNTNVFAIKEQSLLETLNSAKESINKAKKSLEENKIPLADAQREHQLYFGLNETLEEDELHYQGLEEQVVSMRFTIKTMQEELTVTNLHVIDALEMQHTFNGLTARRLEIMKKLNQY